MQTHRGACRWVGGCGGGKAGRRGCRRVHSRVERATGAEAGDVDAQEGAQVGVLLRCGGSQREFVKEGVLW